MSDERERLISDLVEGEQVGHWNAVLITCDHDDNAPLLCEIACASIEQLLDIQSRIRNQVNDYVTAFVDDTRLGQDLLADRIEALKREDEYVAEENS